MTYERDLIDPIGQWPEWPDEKPTLSIFDTDKEDEKDCMFDEPTDLKNS